MLCAADRSRVRQFDRAFGEIDWYVSLDRLFAEEVFPEDMFEESPRMEAARQIQNMNEISKLRQVLR